MGDFGETIRKLRKEKELPLRTVAAFLDIDQAILSKIERGKRNANREQVVKLAEYFRVKDNDLLVSWLSDKLVDEVEGEDVALKALQEAEEKVEYRAYLNMDRKNILSCIIKELKGFSSIQKAWIYGSFSRQDDGPKSDIDIAVKTDENFSYFDLAEIQHHLEKAIKRKVDLGFIDSFKPYIFENVKKDLKLIYER
ncbi:XRE family transcriptional regulator [Pleomorphovibrio marinus]|uniref:XRE family transcriptional regulator n=1 Tax=Pleomorphovibrio marinus TaxID=2164132 RepID=UPI000E0B5230|nr:XRE family transcriptional regulator [Pleomorphovibrio marinus]